MIPEYGFCKCCKNNPAFFADGFCKYCFNYMMDGDKLHPNELIMMVSAAIHYREKHDKTDLAKQETASMKRGMISWAYGDR